MTDNSEDIGPCANCGHEEHDDYTDECHAYCCPCIDYEPLTGSVSLDVASP